MKKYELIDKIMKAGAALATISLTLTILTAPSKVLANTADIPIDVRIGLESKYMNVSQIKITNSRIMVGYELNNSLYGSGSITALSGFSVAASNAWYVRIDTAYNNYNDALYGVNTYKQAGFKAAVALLSVGSWHIYLGSYSSNSEAVSQAAKVANEHATVIVPNQDRISLFDGLSEIIVFDNPDGMSPQMQDFDNNPLNLGDRQYRGRIEFSRFGTNQISAINIITMDNYLYSAVPSEMPSGWHIEALKAQTIAARAYSIARIALMSHSRTEYGLCDRDHCQVYLGAGNESEAGRQAVDATTGQLAYYNNKPINAVFFSSSGGTTASSENVWTDALPYLRGIPDPYDTTGKQWTRTFTLTELTSLANEKDFGIGAIRTIRISKTSDTGRVLELTLEGSLGSKALTKETIRTFFSSSASGTLDSRNFTIANGVATSTNNTIIIRGVTDVITSDIVTLYGISSDGKQSLLSQVGNSIVALGASSVKVNIPLVLTTTVPVQGASSFTFIGSGWGHGVGMSQHGAKGMAEAGYSYIDILKYYYNGVEVY